jgi:hypothetical protein
MFSAQVPSYFQAILWTNISSGYIFSIETVFWEQNWEPFVSFGSQKIQISFGKPFVLKLGTKLY